MSKVLTDLLRRELPKIKPNSNTTIWTNYCAKGYLSGRDGDKLSAVAEIDIVGKLGEDLLIIPILTKRMSREAAFDKLAPTTTHVTQLSENPDLLDRERHYEFRLPIFGADILKYEFLLETVQPHHNTVFMPVSVITGEYRISRSQTKFIEQAIKQSDAIHLGGYKAKEILPQIIPSYDQLAPKLTWKQLLPLE